MLRETIQDDIKQAMRARDAKTLEVLRYLWSEIQNAEIDLKHALSDAEVLDLLAKERKRRNQAIDQFKTAGRTDLSDREEEQLTVLSAYMPEEMSDDQLEAIVREVVNEHPGDFGQVMKRVMSQVGKRADGKRVSEKVKLLLS